MSVKLIWRLRATWNSILARHVAPRRAPPPDAPWPTGRCLATEVVLDKTGTITEGKPSVTDLELLEEGARSMRPERACVARGFGRKRASNFDT